MAAMARRALRPPRESCGDARRSRRGRRRRTRHGGPRPAVTGPSTAALARTRLLRRPSRGRWWRPGRREGRRPPASRSHGPVPGRPPRAMRALRRASPSTDRRIAAAHGRRATTPGDRTGGRGPRTRRPGRRRHRRRGAPRAGRRRGARARTSPTPRSSPPSRPRAARHRDAPGGHPHVGVRSRSSARGAAGRRVPRPPPRRPPRRAEGRRGRARRPRHRRRRRASPGHGSRSIPPACGAASNVPSADLPRRRGSARGPATRP